MLCSAGGEGPGHLPGAATALLCSDPDFQPHTHSMFLLAWSVVPFRHFCLVFRFLFLLFYFFFLKFVASPTASWFWFGRQMPFSVLD